MSGSPWLKFYPVDWRGDPKLRMCSLAARGLWMEMLCIMHEAEPYGSLRVNGRPVNEQQLASLSGTSVEAVRELLDELDAAGVFDREGDAIVSRRMVRDKAKAENDRANGKRGGNPGLREGVNPPDKGEDKAQKPEARGQNTRSSSSLRSDDQAPAKPTPRSLLEGVLDAAHAEAVIEHRQRLRKPLTAHAAGLLAKALAEFPDPNGAADTMIERGWQTIRPGWGENANARAGPRAPRRELRTAADYLLNETMERINGNAGPKASDRPDAGKLPGLTITGSARRDGVPDRD